MPLGEVIVELEVAIDDGYGSLDAYVYDPVAEVAGAEVTNGRSLLQDAEKRLELPFSTSTWSTSKPVLLKVVLL